MKRKVSSIFSSFTEICFLSAVHRPHVTQLPPPTHGEQETVPEGGEVLQLDDGRPLPHFQRLLLALAFPGRRFRPLPTTQPMN